MPVEITKLIIMFHQRLTNLQYCSSNFFENNGDYFGNIPVITDEPTDHLRKISPQGISGISALFSP